MNEKHRALWEVFLKTSAIVVLVLFILVALFGVGLLLEGNKGTATTTYSEATGYYENQLSTSLEKYKENTKRHNTLIEQYNKEWTKATLDGEISDEEANRIIDAMYEYASACRDIIYDNNQLKELLDGYEDTQFIDDFNQLMKDNMEGMLQDYQKLSRYMREKKEYERKVEIVKEVTDILI